MGFFKGRNGGCLEHSSAKRCNRGDSLNAAFAVD